MRDITRERDGRHERRLIGGDAGRRRYTDGYPATYGKQSPGCKSTIQHTKGHLVATLLATVASAVAALLTTVASATVAALLEALLTVATC